MAPEITPSLYEVLRERLAVWRTGFSPMHCELRWLCQHCEKVAFPAAIENRQEWLRLAIHRDATGNVVRQKMGGEPLEPRFTQKLSQMLASLGVDIVELDPKLDASQIYEAFAVLRRIALKRLGTAGGRRARSLAELASSEGLHVGCTSVRIDPVRRTLRIQYSYCHTAFSWAVGFLKRRHRSFRDHRAFFAAAPRYAALALAAGFSPVVLMAIGAGTIAIAAVSAIAAIVVSTAIYLFFLSIGSAEYDNEVKSERLARAYSQIKMNDERIQTDLRRAREFQQRLLPPPGWQPSSARVRISVQFEPKGEVGGDYYDFRELPDGRLAILLADVSGHGLGAALVTGALKAFFVQTDGLLERVEAFLWELNKQLIRLIPEDSFAAVFYGVFDPKSGFFTYCSAGTPPAVWLKLSEKADMAEVRTLREGHAPIVGALLEDWSCTADTVQFQPGDRLLLITDGIYDVLAPDGERFGADRAIRIASESQKDSIVTVGESIVQAAAMHGAGLPQQDDQTVILLEYGRGADVSLGE